MKIRVRYLINGKEKKTVLETNGEQIEFWRRQRNGEVTVIEAKKVK